MNVWPVIVRELRAESRRAASYWLRVGGAATLMVVFGAILLGAQAAPGRVGSHLFTHLNATLFLAIWVLAPLLTADCLSREKREGTLGLLFLTPLRPWGIVLGKSLLHGLRASTLVLAMAPMLAVSLVMGGIAGNDIAMAFLLDSAALILALAAGLIASAWTRDGTRAYLLAEALSALFCFVFLSVHYVLFLRLQFLLGVMPWRAGFAVNATHEAWAMYRQTPLVQGCKEFFELATGTGGSDYWRLTTNWEIIWLAVRSGLPQAWFRAVAGLWAGAALILGLALWLAAWTVARAWQDRPASAGQQRLTQLFCAPRFWRGVFRGKMTRLLQRNPVGWLQQYTWSARLTRLAWCLGLVVAECQLVLPFQLDYLWSGQFVLALLILLALAFAAADSFRAERESGAMELLLVTPLTERQIVFGRARALWGQFLPATGVLLAAWFWLAKDARLYARFTDSWALTDCLVMGGAIYLATPFLGLYLSFCGRLPFVGCWLVASAWGILGPWLVFLVALGFQQGRLPSAVAAAAFALGNGLGAGYLLFRALSRRRFLVAS